MVLNDAENTVRSGKTFCLKKYFFLWFWFVRHSKYGIIKGTGPSVFLLFSAKRLEKKLCFLVQKD